jgi:pyruvate ferredoxin oxidoreductase alpha subunit
MGARDSGWIQIYCENSQEVYDASIAAWRIGEHRKIQLPVMVCLDGFTLSHTMENVMTLPDKEVEAFIGEREFLNVRGHSGVADLRLDPAVPLTMGPLDLQDFYFEHKIHQAEAMKEAIKYMPELDETFSEYSNRRYNSVEPYMMDDAEIAIIGLGSTMGTVRYVVRALRSKGVKAGMVKIRIYRPFPEDDLKDAVGDTGILGIMDKAASFGAPGGPLFSDIRNSFYDETERPQIFNYIYGLGGRDTSPEMIKGIYDDLNILRGKSSIDERVKYIGVRE